jgi:hypothetical protein
MAPKRRKRPSIPKPKTTLAALAGVWKRGIFRQSFFLFSRSIIILDDSLTDNELVIFWIILAGTFFTEEGLFDCVSTVGIVGRIRVISLVRAVIVSIKKPSHWLDNTFWT